MMRLYAITYNGKTLSTYSSSCEAFDHLMGTFALGKSFTKAKNIGFNVICVDQKLIEQQRAAAKAHLYDLALTLDKISDHVSDVKLSGLVKKLSEVNHG